MTYTKKERLKSIIEREVYQRANELLPFLQENHGEAYSDCWSNIFYDDEQLIDFHMLEDKTADEQEQALEELRDNGEDYQEIFEFWLVSEWLYDQLDRENAPVLEFKGVYFWGRTETGQALDMDYYLNRVNNRIEKTVNGE